MATMMPPAIEALLVAVSLVATVVNGMKRWQGWFITSATCICWTTYFTATDQWGPAVIQGVSAVITGRNGVIWYRSQKVNKAENASRGHNPESHTVTAAAVCACAAPETPIAQRD